MTLKTTAIYTLLGALLSVPIGCAGRTSTPATVPTSAGATSPRPAPRVAGAGLVALEPPITSFGATRLGDSVYLLGGYHGTPHAYDREGQERALLRMPIVGGAIERVASLEVGLQSPALVTDGRTLLSIGGMFAANGPGEPMRLHSTRDLFRFEPSSGRLEEIGHLPEGRSSHAAAVLGDRVYVVGGWKLDGGHEGTFARETWVLTMDGQLVARVPQPFERRALGLAALGDRLVAVGGMSPSGPSRETWLLDASGEWSRGPDYPGDAFGLAAVSVDGSVVASGRDGVVHRLAPDGSTWTALSRLTFPRFFHQLVPGESGSVIALGGIIGMSPDARTAIVERVRVDGGPNEPVLAYVPAFGAARNRQGMAVVDDALVLFGGNDALDQHAFEPENFERDAFAVSLASLRVAPLPAHPVARQSMVTTVLANGRVLSLGGFGWTGDATAATSQPEGFLLDVERGTWSTAPSLPGPRTQFGLHAVADTLVVLGGLDYDPSRPRDEAFRHLRDVTIVHADGTRRSIEDGLPGTRRAFASAALGSRIYVVGGMREEFAPVEDCGVFDVARPTWTEIACPSAVRFSASLVPIDGKLYLVGGTPAGEGDEDRARRIEEYDPATNTWRVLATTVPFDPSHLRGFAHRGRLLLASTHAEDRALRLAWIDVAR